MNLDGGKIYSQKFWNLKKKLFPKSRDPPSAMLDHDGNVSTTTEAIQNRVIEVHTKRLKPYKMKEH